MPPTPIPDALEQARAARLVDRLGLRSRPELTSLLARSVQRIALARGATTGSLYPQLMQEPLSGPLLLEVAESLSVGESTFFRHASHFEALEKVILPELLRRKDGELRILSAGCSRGEELYSLAILLERAAPGLPRRMIGFDVNGAALRQAAQGRYRPWSLRGVELGGLGGWLRADGSDWTVNRRAREGVDLVRGTLLDLPAAVKRAAPFDFVFCRNVLIYYRREVGRAVVAELAGLLRPDGVLFVGPADHEYCDGLECVSAGSTFFYRRPGSPTAQPTPASLPAGWQWPPPERVAPPTQPPAVEVAEVSGSNDRYQALLERGRAERERGAYEVALRIFDESIALIPDRPEGYFEQALLLDHRALQPAASALLERALYLDACFAPALVLLASIHMKTGRTQRARQLLLQLDASLQDLPDAAALPGCDAFYAGELKRSARQLLEQAHLRSGT